MSRIPPPPPGFVIDGESALATASAVPPLPPGFELMAAESPFSDVQGGVSSTDRLGLGQSSAQPPRRSLGQGLAREVGGLGLRNVVEGTADLAGIFYDPIADAVNWAGSKGPTTTSLITG